MKWPTLLAMPVIVACAFVAPAFSAATANATTFASAPIPTDADDAALRGLERAFVDASLRQDRAALDRLLDTSYREMSPSGAIRFKTDMLRTPPAPSGSRQTLDNLLVDVDGDRAVVSGTSRFIAPNGATAVFAFSDTFRRDDAAWRIVSSMVARRA